MSANIRRSLRMVLPLVLGCVALAQQLDPRLYQEMKWRMIGPFRGGRTVGAQGIPDQPNVFFIGVNNGGVWKTTDAGRTWKPIFDSAPTGSVGTVAVAPSEPNVIYVGSGEGLRRPDLSTGDGVFKSADGGQTWKWMGLKDAQQIAAILVDPKDPNRIFVAALGHPYGPNAERGIFRSLDGGATFEKVLYKDEDTGGVDLAFDPTNSQKVYAVLWASRRPPWSVGGNYEAPGSGLYVSTDGGTNWRALTKGLPTWEHGQLGRIGITIAPSDPNRMYANVDSPTQGGVFRSDDAGESWTLVNSEERVWGRGSDFAWIRVHPTDKNTIFACNTSTYKSTDGGATFTAFKGAPGGDDYHAVWINPKNPDIILLAADQGATITVNGGQSWSSWYNQPTAQFYHVITDNRFPYRVYGGQQESGSAMVLSRGDHGAISFRDFLPVGAEEYGYIAPDPLDPDIIYGGKLSRFDFRSGQTQGITPTPIRTGKYRFNRTAPVIFAHADPHVLYYGSNVLFKTTDGGNHWEIISPDLTREDPPAPATMGVFVQSDPLKGKHRGVIYSVGPSFQDANTIWAGTDDGLIHLTRDGGKNWSNVTPPELTPWSKVAQLEASHFDNDSAYAAINRFRLDDLHAYIYRTHDGGKSWKQITHGIPDDAAVNAVREDPVRKGLLYAATERAIWVSVDDGENWQSLQQNLPHSSMRDIWVHEDDLVVGTHGRSFWILDNLTPLRQISADVEKASVYLFKPQLTYRVRRDLNTDTPLPPDEPVGQNPPDGAMLDYWLNKDASGPVTLEVLDSSGAVVRRFSSNDKLFEQDPKEINVPFYWVRPSRGLSTKAGMHRFIWNLCWPDPAVLEHGYPISAIIGDTPRGPEGPYVLPGDYTVRLSVGGNIYQQPLSIKMDPRVRATAGDLIEQFKASQRITSLLQKDFDALAEVRSVRKQLAERKSKAGKDAALTKSLTDVEASAAKLESGTRVVGGPEFTSEGLARINSHLARLLDFVQGADAAPTGPVMQQLESVEKLLQGRLREWKAMREESIPALNKLLKKAGAQMIDPDSASIPIETSVSTADEE